MSGSVGNYSDATVGAQFGSIIGSGVSNFRVYYSGIFSPYPGGYSIMQSAFIPIFNDYWGSRWYMQLMKLIEAQIGSTLSAVE
jgi:hypothetical protein